MTGFEIQKDRKGDYEQIYTKAVHDLTHDCHNMGSCVCRAECGDGLCGAVYFYRGEKCGRTNGLTALCGSHG